jgi:hypothetical protein
LDSLKLYMWQCEGFSMGCVLYNIVLLREAAAFQGCPLIVYLRPICGMLIRDIILCSLPYMSFFIHLVRVCLNCFRLVPRHQRSKFLLEGFIFMRNNV